jgi:hypothetical protein
MRTRQKLSLLAALLALVPFVLTATPAQAAGSATGTAAAWYTQLTPHFPQYGEDVWIKVGLDKRNAALHSCARGFVCVAAGEGNGYHDVWFLYDCTQRTLGNFIGDGALTNNQTGNAQVVLKDRNGMVVRTINADNTPTPVRVDWDPIYYLDPC